MKEKYTVYKLVFPNNKIYIGTTKRNPQYRWNKGNGYKSNIKMYNDIQKYGWENIKKIIIDNNLSENDAYDLEKSNIAKYKSNNEKYGYNIQNGGKKGNNIVNDKTKKNISTTMKGRRQGNVKNRMRKIDMFDLNMNYIESFECINDCQRKYGFRKQYIRLCCLGKLKKIDNYIFKFAK